MLLRIVGASNGTHSLALPCPWRSRPQHQQRTCREPAWPPMIAEPPRSLVTTMLLSDRNSRRRGKAVKLLRVLHQNSGTRRSVRHPLRQQVEQDCVVWLFLLGRMRPIACPHHSLGGGFDIGAGNRDRVGITRGAHFAILISAA